MTDRGVTLVGDPGDPRLADYAALTDAALRKRYEHDHGVLIAEGPAPVRALVSSEYPVRSVLVSERRLPSIMEIRRELAARTPPVPILVVSEATLHALVRFRLHQGVLACGGRLALPQPASIVAEARRVVVLEGLNDHENLGALFRSARALHVDAVLLGPGCADPLYRRSVRVSMGHVLHVPFARAASITEALTVLEAAGLATVALTPVRDAVDLDVLAAKPPERIAVVLGAEGPGLSREALARCALRARIPMRAEVDSLNVAAAGAIALHALRPRDATPAP